MGIGNHEQIGQPSSNRVGEIAVRNLTDAVFADCLSLRHDGSSIRAYGTGEGRNGQREDVDGFPLGINRADCISRQLSLMSLSQAVIVHSLLSPFLPSCSFRFPPLSLILYSLFENFHLITFRDILFFSCRLSG